jgi:hypothetical protein
MGLINLQTNLKSLKYGKDRPGGGSSNQPYIVADIPSGYSTGYDNDFILRGGILAFSRTAQDVSRLTQMFIDTKSANGLLFTIKQNALTRLGVKTQAGGQEIYLPTNTLAQAGVSAFGLHLYKQGLNPFPDFSVSGIQVDLPGNIKTYSQIVKNDQSSKTNRLFQLYDVKVLNNRTLYIGNNISRLSNGILQYGGGPNSVLGIGRTNITFADQRTGRNNTNLFNDGFFDRSLGNYIFDFRVYRNKFNVNPNEEIKTTSTLTLGSMNMNLGFAVADGRIFNGVTSTYNYFNPDDYYENERGEIVRNINKIQPISESIDVFNTQVYRVPIRGNNGVLTLDTKQIQSASLANETRGASSFTPVIKDFRAELRTDLNNQSFDKLYRSSIISDSPNYSISNIENRVFLGNPGQPGNIYSYTLGKGFPGKEESALDKITAKPLYQSELVDDEEVNDLVKFRIEAINNDNPAESVFIHFRAFLDSFSDAYNASWSPTKYIGRGEEFFTYGSFTRGISINWTVAAQSKDELIPMYQKLNYLASNLMPDYSTAGYMRGPMMRLTVGGYLYSQPGFITSLTYNVDDTTPWEIGINDTDAKSDNTVKELPHIIRVSMNYTPIHDFVPRKQKNRYNGPDAGSDNKGKYIDKWGKEHYIALSVGENKNNYQNHPNYIPYPKS